MGWERAGSKTPPPEEGSELRSGPLTRTPPLPPPTCPLNTQQPPPLARSSACAAPLEQRRLRVKGAGGGEGGPSFPWAAPMHARGGRGQEADRAAYSSTAPLRFLSQRGEFSLFASESSKDTSGYQVLSGLKA